MFIFDTKKCWLAIFCFVSLVGIGLFTPYYAYAGSDGKGLQENYALAQSHDSLFLQAKKYHDGIGVSQDYEKARGLYLKAAVRGSVDAKVNLGYLYFVGLGVKQDYKQAKNWYLSAAHAGDQAAQKNLSMIYEHGLGVPKDTIKATYWLNKSKAIIITSTAPAAQMVWGVERSKPTETTAMSKPLIINMATNKYEAPSTPVQFEAKLPPITKPQYVKTNTIVAPLWASAALGVGMLFLALMSGAWFVSKITRLNQQHISRDFMTAFYERYADSLRISYLQYPLAHRFAWRINTPWSVALCVLMVRFALENIEGAPNGKADGNVGKKSALIIKQLRRSPFAARQNVFPMVAPVQQKILSDINRANFTNVQRKNSFHFEPKRNRDKKTGMPMPPPKVLPKLSLVK